MVRRKRLKIFFGLLPLFFGITFAYFTWLVWKKLTMIIGDDNTVLFITGSIVALGIWTGYLSIDKIKKKFMG